MIDLNLNVSFSVIFDENHCVQMFSLCMWDTINKTQFITAELHLNWFEFEF